MSRKRKHEKPIKWKRTRGRPVQVMWSEAEYRGLETLVRERGLASMSELFRLFGKRALAQLRARKRGNTVPADPRQTELFL